MIYTTNRSPVIKAGGCLYPSVICTPRSIINDNTIITDDNKTPHKQAGCQKVISSESLHTVAVGSVAATLQNELMDAIKALDLFEARKALTKIVQDEHMRQHVLLCSSANTRHRLRTPLMAAASTGDMPIVGKRGLTKLNTQHGKISLRIASCVGIWHGGENLQFPTRHRRRTAGKRKREICGFMRRATGAVCLCLMLILVSSMLLFFG